MSLRRVSESKALIVVPTVDGGGKQVVAPAQEVVEEETFSDSVAQILSRDFFPELPKLRAYNEWLDAVQSRDFVKMAEVKAKWRRMDAKKRAPSYGETPAGLRSGLGLETPMNEAKRFKLGETHSDALHPMDETQLTVDAKTMTLDAFLSKYTSEDDASFSNLLEKEVTEARRAYRDAYNRAEEVHRDMVAKGRQVGWKKYDPSHAGFLTIPDSLPRTFTPDEMRRGEKAIVPENTRFPEGGPSWKVNKASTNLDATQRGSSASQADRTHEVGGFKSPLPKSTATGSSTGTGTARGSSNFGTGPQASIDNLDAQLYERILKERRGETIGGGHAGLEGEGGALGEEYGVSPNAPRVKGYAMVSTPRLLAGEVDQSPLMTWGEMDGEALRLDSSGLPIEEDDDSSHSSEFGFLSGVTSATAVIAPSRTSGASLDAETSTSGFSVPKMTDKNAALNQLLSKRKKMSSNAASAIGGGGGTRSGLVQHTPSPLLLAQQQQRRIQMTPDLQLRSTYNTPTTRSGVAASATSSATSTPHLKR